MGYGGHRVLLGVMVVEFPGDRSKPSTGVTEDGALWFVNYAPQAASGFCPVRRPLYQLGSIKLTVYFQ